MSFRVPTHVHHRALHDEAVLLDARSDAYLGLNQTGALAWEILAAGGSPDSAVDALVTAFDVDRERARTDVAVLIETLLARGLLEPTRT